VNALAASPAPNLFPWRAPLAADWLERWTALDRRVRTVDSATEATELDAVTIEARRLAGQALGPREHLKLEQLAKRLLSHAERFPLLRHFRIGLIGNRTLSYLIGPLRAAGLARGLLVEAIEAPYDSAARMAFGADDVFAGTKLDATVIALDAAAFPGADDLLDDAGEKQALDDAAAFLNQLARATREKTGAPAIVATMPSTGSRISSADLALMGSAERFAMLLNATIIDGARTRDWLVWDVAALATRIGVDAWFDPIRYHEAKTPFRIELSAVVADHLCRILAAMAGKACRALVVDLDNTIWGGVIGDDGLSGIRLGQNSAEGEAFVAFQRFILELRRRGIAVAVCSKNTDAIAREPFRSHPEMLLKEAHIAVFQANWEDKASNIKAIAETLGLGLESLAFADDNPAERERVRQELPLVSVPELGDEPAFYPARIADSGVFEHLLLNADDLGRAQSYQSRAAGAELKSKIGNYDEYLASLKMTLTVSRFDAVGRPRIAQLVNKSNQFNLTTRRYNEEDVRRLEEDRDGVLCWQAQLDDAFGQHGMIGVVIARKQPRTWSIDSWLMSCRVLSRGVEETLMNLLVAEAWDAGAETVTGEYLPTPRNGMVADFFPRLGFELAEEGENGGKRYVCHTASYVPRKSFIEVVRT